MGAGGLLHFVSEYFFTLKKQIIGDEVFDMQTQKLTVKLTEKWFTNLTPMVESLFQEPDENPLHAFHGPIFRHLPNTKLPRK